MNARTPWPRAQRAVTLVEILVVILLLGILVLLAAPSFSALIDKRRVSALAHDLAQDLAYSRSESLMSGQTIVVQLTEQCYALWFGNAEPCNCTLKAPNCSEVGALKRVDMAARQGLHITPNEKLALEGGLLRFTPPQARPSVAEASITVSGNQAYALRVDINPLGRIRVCSPDGASADLPRC